MMRVYLAAFAVMAVTAAEAPKNQDLAPIRSVYLMPMNNGFDQYLANRITAMRRFAVVTDAASADAVLTDRLGLPFETRFAELYPEAKNEGEEKTEQRDTRVSTFGRGRGNLFLVDRQTRQVIWSAYKLPRNMQPNELDKLAAYFADELTKQAPPLTPRAPAPVVVPSAAPEPPSAPPAPPTGS